jgi:NADH-quinone oxidoreductase subunit L
MVRFAAREEIGGIVRTSASSEEAEARIAALVPEWREQNYGYWLLVVAGLGIFCGCVGKSAQFPLHVWLPDAMEGPTPVSALVHSATMVAAGVYLTGRFYPAFAPEVLLVIAYIGGITLFLAATMALVAVDIKRVLAFSTISQLGYMMLGLGVGGWLAGLFHLITHAFFKSLLFMCSGSVIHATHTNDMRRMGGLRHKMPWTAGTMLVGCLAIAGAGLPFAVGPYTLGLSGYYSKDAIVSQALMFSRFNSVHTLLFYAVVVGAGITAFYMFRLWYMTFAGKPRDHHVYDHAHESPKVMYIPLVILAVFALGVAWRMPGTDWELINLLEQARPAGGPSASVLLPGMSVPYEPELHAEENAWMHHTATFVAAMMALGGFALATVFYGRQIIDPEEARRQFAPIHSLFWHKWWFDELYQKAFVVPVLFVSRKISQFDGKIIDRFIDGCAWGVRWVARLDDAIDRWLVDGLVNYTARKTYDAGISLRALQTGQLRQYVMFIGVGTVALFVLVSFLWSYATAGG